MAAHYLHTVGALRDRLNKPPPSFGKRRRWRVWVNITSERAVPSNKSQVIAALVGMSRDAGCEAYVKLDTAEIFLGHAPYVASSR